MPTRCNSSLPKNITPAVLPLVAGWPAYRVLLLCRAICTDAGAVVTIVSVCVHVLNHDLHDCTLQHARQES